MKKVFLILICLLMLLLFSGCHFHIDADPWPASPGYVEPEGNPAPTITLVQPNPAVQPTGFDTPEYDEFVPIMTPTPAPNDQVVEPGFNG